MILSIHQGNVILHQGKVILHRGKSSSLVREKVFLLQGSILLRRGGSLHIVQGNIFPFSGQGSWAIFAHVSKVQFSIIFPTYFPSGWSVKLG